MIFIARITKLFLALFIILQFTGALAQNANEQEIFSPNGAFQFVTYSKADASGVTSWYYHLYYNKQEVVLESKFDIELDNHLSEWALAIKAKPEGKWMDGLALKDVVRNTVNTSWKPLYGERSTVKENYNGLNLKFEQTASANYVMNIEVRLYNEGLAFRYYFGDNPTGIYYRITQENTEFTFAQNTKAWFEPWAQGPFSLLPLKDWPAEGERPLTLQLNNGLYACLTEAVQTDYVKTKFKLSKDKPNTVQTAMYESVDKVPYFGTPWRVVMAAKTPGDLLQNNTILLNLNEPNKLKDTSWIKPGKIVRDLTLTNEGARAWIDFASKHNIQYVLFDWKWYGPAFTFDSDASKVVIPNFDLPEIIKYGKEKGVGIWLYVNQQALFKQDMDIFPLYKKWGVAGIKYGFVEVGSHRWTAWLHESVQRAADNQLMVNIHDEFRLTGEERTWPNILTVEGIRGNEEMPDATHNTILPFTRGIAGAGDYTVCYYTSRIKTTHAHQLALGVVMYSPLQTLFWYDKASDYSNEPEIEFFDNLPTVWDETKILSGKPGEHIATARRKGNEWFVGIIAGNDGKEVDINFDFLQKGTKYTAKVYSDDPAVNTKTHVKVETKTIKGNDKMHISIKKSGGYAMWIKPYSK